MGREGGTPGVVFVGERAVGRSRGKDGGGRELEC